MERRTLSIKALTPRSRTFIVQVAPKLPRLLRVRATPSHKFQKGLAHKCIQTLLRMQPVAVWSLPVRSASVGVNVNLQPMVPMVPKAGRRQRVQRRAKVILVVLSRSHLNILAKRAHPRGRVAPKIGSKVFSAPSASKGAGVYQRR